MNGNDSWGRRSHRPDKVNYIIIRKVTVASYTLLVRCKVIKIVVIVTFNQKLAHVIFFEVVKNLFEILIAPHCISHKEQEVIIFEALNEVSIT